MKSRMEVLSEFIEQNSWTTGAELGVNRGDTHFYLLDRFPGLSLIGVDLWQPLRGVVGKRNIAETVIKRSQTYDGRSTIYHTLTTQAAEYVKGNSLDFIFIDANHSGSFVLSDICVWLSKIKPLGWMMGHDFKKASVWKTLNVWLPGWRKHDGSVWSIPRSEIGIIPEKRTN